MRDLRILSKSEIPETLSHESAYLFWGGPLSNFSPYPIVEWSEAYDKLLEFPTSEHYFMFCKALIFKDYEAMDQILQVSSPKEAKMIGRAVKDFDSVTWDKTKIRLMFRANVLKGIQHEPYRKFLSSTKDKVLIECSPYDTIWGIGLSSADRRCITPKFWKGENLLGFTLMKVREKLTEYYGG